MWLSFLRKSTAKVHHVGAFAGLCLILGTLIHLENPETGESKPVIPFGTVELPGGHQIEIPVYVPAIDWGVITNILGTSLFVEVTSRSGVFTWLAIKLTKKSGGNLTPIGSASTVIAATIIHRENIKLGFMVFVKVAAPFAIARIVIAVIYVLIVRMLFGESHASTKPRRQAGQFRWLVSRSLQVCYASSSIRTASPNESDRMNRGVRCQPANIMSGDSQRIGMS